MAEKKSSQQQHKEADRQRNTAADARKVEKELRLTSPEIYEVVNLEGIEELNRPVASLWWSGVAAGLALSTSVYFEGFLRQHLPDADWRPLVQNFGYCIGFLIVVMGRLQLFTENTISPVLSVFAEPSTTRIGKMLRLWAIVLLANLLGCLLSALVAGVVGVASEEQIQAILEIAREAVDKEPWAVLLKGIPAGFLVAALVWILPSAKGSQFWVIVAVTYAIAMGDFTHVVAGSTEVFLLMLAGEYGIIQGTFGYGLPSLVGNVIGGTGLFTILAYAQVKSEL